MTTDSKATPIGLDLIGGITILRFFDDTWDQIAAQMVRPDPADTAPITGTELEGIFNGATEIDPQ